MSWKDSDEALGSGLFFSLKNDGDSAIIQILGEPTPRHGIFNSKPRTQFVFPIATTDGLHVWPVGVKLYKRLRDDRAKLVGKPLAVKRKGAAGDVATWYELVPCKAPAALKSAIGGITQEDIDTAVEAALGSSDKGE